jgi:hypothetical protein
MKSNANPMQRAHDAPRCAAHSKRTGQLCKSPAVRGWSVCRMHGAGGGASAGTDHPNYRHGLRSQEWIAMRKKINDFARFAREI